MGHVLKTDKEASGNVSTIRGSKARARQQNPKITEALSVCFSLGLRVRAGQELRRSCRCCRKRWRRGRRGREGIGTDGFRTSHTPERFETDPHGAPQRNPSRSAPNPSSPRLAPRPRARARQGGGRLFLVKPSQSSALPRSSFPTDGPPSAAAPLTFSPAGVSYTVVGLVGL
jgi:hypothetical protein